MWSTLGIGRKVAGWFDKTAVEDPRLFQSDHADRTRVDAILGRLVSLDISEAHEIELKMQAPDLLIRHAAQA
jgi:hypothetical protein